MSRFRNLLEEHDLGQRRFDKVQRHLAAKGVKLATGTIVPPFCCMGKTRVWSDQANRGQRAVIR